MAINKLKKGISPWRWIPVLSFGLAMVAQADLNYPQRLHRDHHQELQEFQSRSGLMKSNQFVQRFISDGERELERLKDYLDGDSKHLIRESLVRAKLVLNEEDQAKRIELVNQILELGGAYYNFGGKAYHDVRHTRPALYRHPFFNGIINPLLKHLPFHQVENDENLRNVRIFSPNLADSSGQLIPLEELMNHQNRDQLDPVESDFWQKVDLSQHETYEYEKDSLYPFICDPQQAFYFKKTKTLTEEGGGWNPGAKIYAIDSKGQKVDLSLKFKIVRRVNNRDEDPFFAAMEAYVETGTNAIYKSLGYNVDQTYYCPQVKLHFDPAFLNLAINRTENLLPWKSDHLFSKVELVDGTILDFRAAMDEATFLDSSIITTEYPWAEYYSTFSVKKEYEGKIKYLYTIGGGHIEYRHKDLERLKHWARSRMSHEDRRELRGLGIIDAWLASLDIYSNNLKVVLHKNKDKTKPGKMKFTLVDTGDCFNHQDMNYSEKFGYMPLALRLAKVNGDIPGFELLMDPYRAMTNLEIYLNGYSWSIFKKKQVDPTPDWGSMTEDQKIERVVQDLTHMDFKEVTEVMPYNMWEDLRWGVRKIAGISEKQFINGFSMGGLGYPAIIFLTEKMMHRRDQLVKYFDLEKEFPLLRPHGPQDKMTLEGEGEIQVKTSRGWKKIKIPSNGHAIRDGVFYGGEVF